MGRHRRERNPVKGKISGVLDTGRGSLSGGLTKDDVDDLDAPTERQGRLKPAAKMLEESRGTDPLHKRFER
jgi:hypothetical protein